MPGRHKSYWDAINLESGKFLFLHPSLGLYLKAGFGYMVLKETLVFDTQGLGTDAIFREHTITYNGLGPRVGANASYEFLKNLSTYIQSGIGIFSGMSRENAYGLAFNGVNTSSSISSMFIVPEFNLKLGAKYNAHLMSHLMTIDVGWLWINYFDALITRVGGPVHAANMGYQGPNLGFRLQLN